MPPENIVDTILIRDSMQRMTESAQKQSRAHTCMAWGMGVSALIIVLALVGGVGYLSAALGDMRARHDTALATAISQADEARRAANRIEDKVRDIRKRLPPVRGDKEHGQVHAHAMHGQSGASAASTMHTPRA